MSEPSDPCASIVVVGNEVLSAKVQDENIPFLLDRLRRLGVPVVRVTIVPDRTEVLVETYRQHCREATWVFSTGGVGPTHDDVTMAAVAGSFGRPLVLDPTMEELIRKFFGDRVNEFHLAMANVPEGAELVWGPGLKVPVVKVENLFVFPGTPGLVRSKFLAIEERFRHTPFFTEHLHLDVDEALIAALLAEVEDAFEGIEIGSYPVFGLIEHKVQVIVEGKDEAQVRAAAERIREGLPEGALVAAE